MKKYVIFIISLLLLITFMPYFVKNMKERPIYEKLGFLPRGKFYKTVIGEFRWFLGEYFTFKAITYYGTKVGRMLKGEEVDVEYFNLYKTIETAVLLNPYHEDAYYFAQAAFVWDIGRVKEVNSLLEYVFKYRKWDFQIPFFLGFNYSYFFKDYKKAAEYFKKAAELSGIPFFATLSARYFYESGHIELGIMFLEYMIKNTRKENIKKFYQKRLIALKAIYLLKKAVNKYKKTFGHLPSNLNDLVKKGIIEKLPEDPYGGKFYLDKTGKIRTTSKLTEAWKKHGNYKDRKSNKDL
ncbi:MAG TPA: hypothetical protein ENG63_04295 [Candidatus Desulfofervidus auxilii]|uniref:Tetratricopeptide repeat protein n=1 Tax=Desulfofervidus auxilii TaxID=1621989 RepID=A0A7C0Y2K3_DESA2|nr:hypothetical protein [Candidatus Desulfofervidus auxilii]